MKEKIEPTFFDACWFFTKIALIDVVVTFILWQIIDYVGLASFVAAIFLLIFSILFFVCWIIFSIILRQKKEIEEDNKENYALHN